MTIKYLNCVGLVLVSFFFSRLGSQQREVASKDRGGFANLLGGVDFGMGWVGWGVVEDTAMKHNLSIC